MSQPPKQIVLGILKRILQGLLIIALGYWLALLGAVIWCFEVKLNRWPVFVYATPPSVAVGDEISKIKLFARLRRIGYASSGDSVPEAGQWHESGAEISVFLRHCPLRGEGIVSGPISLSLDWDRVASIRLMRSLEEVNRVTLEPELICVIPPSGYDPELCRPMPLDKIPQLLVDAVVLTEDDHFFSHSGIDLRSIRRALATNWKAGRYVQGGSTISQQLIRMTILSPDKNLMRKVNEVFLALVADAVYSKQTILEAYLNRVYLGQRGAYPIKGVVEAARNLFGKDITELDAGECALIAASIRAPNVITPHKHPERARERRNMILSRLFKAGKISREVYDEALGSHVRMTRTGSVHVRAPAFVELVKDQLPSEVPGSDIRHLRQDVITSLDALLQQEADLALRPLSSAGLSAYMICAEPRTGEIKALLTPAGPDPWSGKGGDPASLLPFIIIPALHPDNQETVKRALTSHPLAGSRSSGSLTLRLALLKEKTTLTRQMVELSGTERVISLFKEFGIEARPKGHRTLFTEPITPMQMAQNYCLMATLGNAPVLKPGLRIVEELPPDRPKDTRRVSVQPAVLFLLNHLLKGLAPATDKDVGVDKGQSPSQFTARDQDGLWSVAYDEDALVLLRISGSSLDENHAEALTKRLMPEQPRAKEGQSLVPEGIVFRNTCVESGLRATSLCPRVIREPFLKGDQPADWCPLRHDHASKHAESGKKRGK